MATRWRTKLTTQNRNRRKNVKMAIFIPSSLSLSWNLPWLSFKSPYGLNRLLMAWPKMLKINHAQKRKEVDGRIIWGQWKNAWNKLALVFSIFIACFRLQLKLYKACDSCRFREKASVIKISTRNFLTRAFGSSLHEPLVVAHVKRLARVTRGQIDVAISQNHPLNKVAR